MNSLGLESSRFRPRQQDKHFQFDLNDAQYPDKWLSIESHDLIIMGEVLEHLYTSPKLVLRCVSTWLSSGGYLIIQTPNACALHKRLLMAIGKNPYELIRDGRTDPGHFREYTMQELIFFSVEAGFKIREFSTHNYFNTISTLKHKVYNATCSILPSGLREGITLCLQKC